MLKFFYSLFVGLVIMVLPYTLLAQEVQESYRVIKDLKRTLLIYSASEKNYVPHPHNTPVRGNVISVNLNIEEFTGNTLFICGQPNTALFIDQKIVASQNDDKCISLAVDSLFEVYGEDSDKKSLFISVYHKDLDIDELEFTIVKKLSNKEIAQLENEKELSAISRSISPFRNFFIIGLFLIMACIAMIKGAYPKIFSEFYSVGKIFTFRWREDSLIANRPINTVNLLFLSVYSLLTAFIVVVLWFETDSAPQRLGFVDFSNFSSSFFSWISIAVLVFILMILKYFLIYVSSSLLGFKDLISFHFLDFIRISQIFMILVLVVISLSMVSFHDFIEPSSGIFSYLVFSVIVLTTTLLFFKLLSSTNYRNMHLFSYLCTTEILPLIISIKFFLNL